MIKARSRLFSLAVAIVMLVSVVSVFAEEAALNPELAWEPMDDEYAIINQLGIVSDEQWALNLDEQVTRAEFAVYMQKLSGINEAEPDNTLKDVMNGTIEEKAIYAVYNAGIIEPVSDGYFYPSYPITQKDAIKSVVKVLGYPEVELKGLSPYDYANKVGLTEGVSAVNERLTRRDVYKIIYNALFAELLDMSYTSDGVENVTISENTYFALRYDANIVKGIVNAVGKVVLGNTGSSVKDNAIVVGNTALNMTEPVNVADLIGRNVTCYYDDDYNVLAIHEFNNEVTVLDNADDYQYEDGMYVVYEGEREKKIRLDSPYVMLNDEEYRGEYTESVMTPEYGKTVLIDNDRDGKVEIILLYYYEYIFVNSVNGDTRKILDVSKGLVDLSGYEELTVYNSKGKISTLSEFRQYDVVKVIAGRADITLSVCTAAPIKGNIEGQGTDSEGKLYYRINGTDYYFSAYALNALNNGKLSHVEKGKNYSFYLNDENEIVYFIESSSGGARHYGVMTGLKKPGIFGGHDEDDDVIIYSKFDGDFKSYPLAEKVTVNESKGLKHAEVYKQMSRLGKTGAQEDAFIPQVVVWATNSNGEINYIEQASVRGDGTDGFFEFFAVPNAAKMKELTGKRYNSMEYGWQYTLVAWDPDGKINISNDSVSPGWVCAYFPSVTEVFTVPYRYDEESGTFRIATDREDLFALSQISISEQVDMIAYKDDPSEMMAKLVIKCVDANAKLNCGDNMDIQMVKSITTELIDDETVYKMVLANEKEIRADISKFNFESLSVFDASTGEVVGTHNLKVGDLIRYTADARDNLTAIEPVYDHVNRVFLGGKADEKDYKYYGSRSPWAIQKFMLYETDENNYGRFLRYQDDIEATMNDLEKAYVWQIKPAYVYREAEGRSPAVVEAATDADFISYTDSKTEYVDIISTQSNMNLGDYYFIYKHN